MSEHFDPYHKWLGIPLKDQPPNHYRLLGVDRYESDREVIDAAANRLMAYLHDLSTGDQAEAAQRLLNQIAAARLLLLTPAKKAAYDDQLRAESAPMARPVAPTSPPVATPVTPAAPTHSPMSPAPPAPSQQSIQQSASQPGPFVVADEPRGRRSPASRGAAHKPRKQPSVLPIVILAVAALFIAAIATYVLMQPGPQPQRSSSGGSAAATTQLRILIEESERDGVLISIDGQKQSIPKKGVINLTAKPGTRALLIRRRGYRDISQDVEISGGFTTVFQPIFKAEKDKKKEEFDIPENALNDLSNVKPKTGDKDGAKADGDSDQRKP